MTTLTTVRAKYAELIRERVARTVEAFLEIGRALIDAKAELPHGEFQKMVISDLSWKPRTAQRLMAVARSPVLSNPTNWSRLPPSSRRLYDLARVESGDLERMLRVGAIKADMTRNEVRAVFCPLKPPTQNPGFHLRSDRGKRKRIDSAADHVPAGNGLVAELPRKRGSEPSADKDLRGFTLELDAVVDRVRGLLESVRDAQASGRFGVAGAKVPYGEESAAEHLAYLEHALDVASLRLGDQRDRLVAFCGLPRGEQS